jgi:hypothetical protein
VDHGVDCQRVVTQALLDQAGQRGPHQRPVEADLVHQLEARRRLAERRQGLDAPPEDLAVGLALGVADLEVLLLGARRRHPLEGRVGDVLADLALDRDLRAPVGLDVLDDAGVLGREELRQRIRGLVHVVVHVEDRELELS